MLVTPFLNLHREGPMYELRDPTMLMMVIILNILNKILFHLDFN